ncbi:MAG: putative toxin-antitoxin system toxin component, PIN family [Thermoplasmatota archaeon]
MIKEDPDDNYILETAVEGEADLIITGDNHLLKLEMYENIKINQSGKY